MLSMNKISPSFDQRQKRRLRPTVDDSPALRAPLNRFRVSHESCFVETRTRTAEASVTADTIPFATGIPRNGMTTHVKGNQYVAIAIW